MILRSYDDSNGIFVMEKLLSVEKQVENGNEFEIANTTQCL